MKIDEYIRHKERIEESYRRKIESLKVIYPEEWAFDHSRKEKPKDLRGR